MLARDLLQRHLESTGTSRATFASTIGVSKTVVTFWLNGDRRPSASSALLIQSATGGTVPFMAWFPDSIPTKKRRANRAA
jgi:DNA-binding transcriptional regulator YdaS (Cro superfamily)